MGAIFKKEFKSFFTSPVGYFVLALILALSGYFFTGYNLVGGSSELSGVYGSVFSLVLVLVLLPTLLTKLEWLIRCTTRKLTLYSGAAPAPEEVTA